MADHPLVRRAQELIRRVRGALLTRVAFIVVLMTGMGGLAAFTLEHRAADANIKSLPDAIWWSIVTIATVGYGDRYPVTLGGRLVALFLMLFGVGALSVFTATVASFFVEKRIRERMGVESFRTEQHHIVCGWNGKVRQILAGFEADAAKQGHTHEAILIHEGDPDAVTALEPAFPHLRLHFVRGDYTSETTLKRANVQKARSIAFLADDQHQDSCDERNIIAAQLALHLNNNLHVCAELRDGRYRPHLERLEVDNIIVSGEYDGFILSNAIVAPGVPTALQQLLDAAGPSPLREVEIPATYHGQPYERLSEHFRKHGSLLIGLGRKRPSLSLKDLVSDEDSYIDQFIRRKFQEAEREYFSNKGNVGVLINPEPGEAILPTDCAIVIGRG